MRYLFGFLMALAVLAFAACGDNDGNCVESVDVAGEWEMTTTDVIDSCGGRVPYTFPMTITQNGNALTAELPGGTLTGTICGDQVRLSGSFPEDDGTVTTSAALIVSADGDSMQGSDSWSWTDGFTDCSGSDSLSGTRMTAPEFPCTEQGIRDAIAEGGGPRTFDCDGSAPVVTQAEIEINNDVILDGEGNLTVDGNEDHRVFRVEEGVTAELRGFAVTRGGPLHAPGTGSDAGGGIFNLGTLTVTDCTVSGNSNLGIKNGFAGPEGETSGTLTLTNSTVSGNSPDGAVLNIVGTLTLTNSTVSGNTMDFGDGSIINLATMTITNSTVSGNTGGGVRNSDPPGPATGALTLTNTTVSGNTPFEDGGIRNDNGTVTLANSLVDGGCSGDAVTSNGYNIEGPGNTCGFDTEKGDQFDVTDDLNLSPLVANGGPTMTHALLPGSVAIDVIPAVDCVDADGAPLTTDQRGEPRPAGADSKCDVGSFERQREDP